MRKLMIVLAIAAALALSALACAPEGDDHATPAWEVAGYTVQAGDAMDLSCTANPTDPNCDAFRK